jgi:hypothetical protein
MTDEVSWLAIEKGWQVVAAGGEAVGRIDEVLGDAERDIFNGLSIATSLLGRPRYVPAERVARISEGRVELDLAEAGVDALERRDAPPSFRLRG